MVPFISYGALHVSFTTSSTHSQGSLSTEGLHCNCLSHCHSIDAPPWKLCQNFESDPFLCHPICRNVAPPVRAALPVMLARAAVHQVRRGAVSLEFLTAMMMMAEMPLRPSLVLCNRQRNPTAIPELMSCCDSRKPQLRYVSKRLRKVMPKMVLMMMTMMGTIMMKTTRTKVRRMMTCSHPLRTSERSL